MNGMDHLWIVICACFVFFMQAGFICYEVGFVRTKNVVSVAIENIIAFVIATLAYCLVGFTFMFGETQGGVIGASNWFLQNLGGNYDYIFVFYELMFAGTAVTIFAGSMSERTKLKALVIAAIVTGAVIYPVFGHWVWGGNYTAQRTFLSGLGFMDYAGATVVHSTAGWVALAGTIVLGPRKDRWDENGKPRRMGRSNIPFAALGTFIYRIVQECLTNVIKHSGASHVDVNMFTLNSSRFFISVIDNGCGFDLQAVDSGMGLTSIRERCDIPDQIDGLILSNTGMNTANHGDHNFPQEVLEKWDDPAFTERFIRRCFSKPIEPYLYEELYEYARKLNAQSVYQVSSSLRKTDLSDEICNIRCPVSIVHGRDDQVRKISHAQDLADRLPDATLSLISGGHTVMVENREEWMKELDALLLRVINRKGVNAIGFK